MALEICAYLISFTFNNDKNYFQKKDSTEYFVDIPNYCIYTIPDLTFTYICRKAHIFSGKQLLEIKLFRTVIYIIMIREFDTGCLLNRKPPIFHTPLIKQMHNCYYTHRVSNLISLTESVHRNNNSLVIKMVFILPTKLHLQQTEKVYGHNDFSHLFCLYLLPFTGIGVLKDSSYYQNYFNLKTK